MKTHHKMCQVVEWGCMTHELVKQQLRSAHSAPHLTASSSNNAADLIFASCVDKICWLGKVAGH